ncbi:Eco57I restriction-modification methylase domain-containing protein [Anoxynatronum buryatiense]|nr:TaqI-like C-terminal specificity domain-containing protein [Anoxynatronum buryatiense]
MRKLGVNTLAAAPLHEDLELLNMETQGAHDLFDNLNKVDLFQTEILDELFQQSMNPDFRESSGSYYTETPLAAFMVKESLRTHYHQWMKGCSASAWFPLDLIKSENDPGCIPAGILEAQEEWLDLITVLDLSCGSGVFLRQGLIQLAAVSNWVNEKRGLAVSMADVVMKIGSRHLTGVDKEPEAVMMADMLLRIEMMRQGGVSVITPGIQNIHLKVECGDALTWEPAADERYQLILGNPPYLGEKGNRRLFDSARSTRAGALYYEKNMDFSYYFLHRGLDLLHQKGCLCYITTSYFTTADGARKLRQRLHGEVVFHWLINPEKTMIFPHAKGQHNLIYCLGVAGEGLSVLPRLLHLNQPMDRTALFNLLYHQGLTSLSPAVFASTSALFDQRGQLMVRSPGRNKSLLQQMEQKTVFQIQDLCYVNQGLVSGADRLTRRHNDLVADVAPGTGIFVLDEIEKDQLVTAAPEVAPYIKPFFKNSHIWPYEVACTSNQWLLYLTDKNLPDISRIKPLEQHLTPYRPILEKRREVAMGLRKWHSLHWPRDPDIFESVKIVAPQRAMLNVFARSNTPWYASADVYYLKRRETCFHSLDYLVAWLNSALCYAWLSQYGKMKGSDLELYASPLKAIPVPSLPGGEAEQRVMKMVDDYRLSNQEAHNPEQMRSFLEAMDRCFLEQTEISLADARPLLEQVCSLRRRFRRRQVT